MRIVCPSCEAVYDVPASVIDARRTLRCARCMADFTPGGAPPAMEPEPEPEPASPEAVPPPPAYVAVPDAEMRATAPLVTRQTRVRRHGAGLAVAWLASFALLGTMGWAAVTWRGAVMRAWPESERAYVLLGLRK